LAGDFDATPPSRGLGTLMQSSGYKDFAPDETEDNMQLLSVLNNLRIPNHVIDSYVKVIWVADYQFPPALPIQR